MKVVKTSRKQEDAKEMYKVGNVIYNGIVCYLIVEGDEGYALINLSNNSVFMEQSSLSALAKACWNEGDRLVDAELTIVE